MGETTKISWTTRTWNPWKGCHNVGPECDHCYAEAAFKRTGWDFDEVTRTKTWADPPNWQRQLAVEGRSEFVFACSWSDFFLPEADVWRPQAWQIIHDCPNLIWQILTKRPGLIPKRLPPDWGPDGYPNVWLGTSVGLLTSLWRIKELVKVPARIHFLSLEPLLEDLMPELREHLTDIEWGIVGGESGPHFRPMNLQWARNIRDEFHRRGIPFFFKQSAAIRPEMGTRLDGQTYDERPSGVEA